MQSDAKADTTYQVLVIELSRSLEPLIAAIEAGPLGITVFLDNSGLSQILIGRDAEKLFDQISKTIVDPLTTIKETLLEGEQPSLDDLPSLLKSFRKIFEGINELSNLQFESPDAGEIGKQLTDYLIVRYLHDYQPGWYSILVLTGLVSGYETPGIAKIDLQQLSTLINNPNDGIRRFLGWGAKDADFKLFIVLYYLKALLWSNSISATFESPDKEVAKWRAALSEHSAPKIEDALANQQRAPLYGIKNTDLLLEYPHFPDEMLRVSILSGQNGSIGVKIVPLPGIAKELPGFAIFPYGVVKWDDEIDLSSGWKAVFKVSAKQDDWGLVVVPHKDSWKPQYAITSTKGNAIGGELQGEVKVELDSAESKSNDDGGKAGRTLLGDPSATNLSLNSIAATTVLNYAEDELEFKLALPASGKFTIKPEGGFLKTVIPKDITFDFDATIGWSNQDGFYFGGGGTLEASLPQHLDLGFGTLQEVYLAIDPTAKDADFSIDAAATPKLNIGPVKGRVKRLGISANVSFPEDRKGNMGPLDFALGFRPPNGLGISIDTGAVSGAGVLQFYPDEHRYVGGFEIQIESYGLAIVGLLKTKLANTDGFSLLLLITADLPPVQLGFGFVMTGIGGLAGIHRAFKTKELGRAVRNGSMNSVLFPKNVVDNADQIFSDLRSIFPPRPDYHVFGPMLELGWGTPTVIRAQLGVLVSIPSWNIALLGKFLVDLPDEKVALIDLNLAVLGVLDIPNKRLAIDASLYDSRVVQWSLSGDMAMRLTWGQDSRFMLSVGGFHPRYNPPSDFPELDRVRASLSVPGGNPRLEMWGYLAVTPNTFQVGAGIAVHAEAGPASVDGKLSFDALFRFNPFSFVIDFYAGLTFRLKGKTLSIKVDGTLKGPQPYRLKGKVTIDFLFFSVTIPVNVKIGPTGGDEELPPAKVLPKLVEALGKPQNWIAQPPEEDYPMVTQRDRAEGEEDLVLVHPLGTIGVRQQIVPLEVEIEKYGNAKPQHTYFAITSMKVGDEELSGEQSLREKFAPARFRQMSDEEKLQAPAFEKLAAGRMMKKPQRYVDDDDQHCKEATLSYEISIIDRKNPRYRTTAANLNSPLDTNMPKSIGEELAKVGALASAKTRTTGSARYRNTKNSVNVSVSDQSYVMVWADDLTRVKINGNPKAGRTRVEIQDRMRQWQRDNPDQQKAVQIVGRNEIAKN